MTVNTDVVEITWNRPGRPYNLDHTGLHTQSMETETHNYIGPDGTNIIYTTINSIFSV